MITCRRLGLFRALYIAIWQCDAFSTVHLGLWSFRDQRGMLGQHASQRDIALRSGSLSISKDLWILE
jgi:hypothetical protein